jgi:hypothetical protein
MEKRRGANMMTKSTEEILAEWEALSADPKSNQPMTEEEELDDDADGGYFQQYDENGDEIKD